MVRSSFETVSVRTRITFCPAGLTALVIGTVWRVGASFVLVSCLLYNTNASLSSTRSRHESFHPVWTGHHRVPHRDIPSRPFDRIFIQGREETTYIYPPGWILLTSTSFMANIVITSCIAVRRYHYTNLSEGVDSGYGLDLAVLVH